MAIIIALANDTTFPFDIIFIVSNLYVNSVNGCCVA
jgi:hypothetical protein